MIVNFHCQWHTLDVPMRELLKILAKEGRLTLNVIWGRVPNGQNRKERESRLSISIHPLHPDYRGIVIRCLTLLLLLCPP